MAFFKYTAVRFGITAAVLIVCLLLQLGWIVSAVVAVVIAFCISYLFLGNMRAAANKSIEHRLSGKAAPLRTSAERDDAAAEDAYIESHRDPKQD